MLFEYREGQIFYCKKSDKLFLVNYVNAWMNMLVFQVEEGLLQFIGAREMRYFKYIGDL